MHRKGRRIIFFFLLIFSLGAVSVFGADYTWDGEALNGDWQNPVNWYNDTTSTNDDGFPSGAGDTATFGNFTVTLTNIQVELRQERLQLAMQVLHYVRGQFNVDALVLSDEAYRLVLLRLQ
jgi:hypothetical protein